MPKVERGTPKDIANRMKAKGLQKLKFYCQMCSKQCRDENGFKCHLTSDSHLRNMRMRGGLWTHSHVTLRCPTWKHYVDSMAHSG